MANGKSSKKQKKSVVFELYAPEAKTVWLAGSFNSWDPAKHPLKKGEKGIWKVTIDLSPGRHEYRYKIDDTWQNDPSAAEYAPNAFGTWNCVIAVQ